MTTHMNLREHEISVLLDNMHRLLVVSILLLKIVFVSKCLNRFQRIFNWFLMRLGSLKCQQCDTTADGLCQSPGDNGNSVQCKENQDACQFESLSK